MDHLKRVRKNTPKCKNDILKVHQRFLFFWVKGVGSGGEGGHDYTYIKAKPKFKKGI